MATFKVGSVERQSDISSSLGRVATDIDERGAIGAGQVRLGKSFEDVSRAAASIFGDMQQRRNERLALTEEIQYKQFRQNLLYGDEGLMKTPAHEFEGVTERAMEELNKYAGDRLQEADNPRLKAALESMLGRDIASVSEQVARHEGRQLEAVRRTTAGAAIQTNLDDAIRANPDVFIPGEGEPYDPVFKADLAEKLQIQDPTLSDEAAEAKAVDHMSAAAAEAVFAQLDLFAGDPATMERVMEIQTAWEGSWAPQTRAAVSARILDEGAWGMMDEIVKTGIGLLNEKDPQFSKSDLSKAAAELFRNQWAEKYGGTPIPDKHIREVKRRAQVAYELEDESFRQIRAKKRESVLTPLLGVVVNGGNAAEFESAFKTAVQQAQRSNDSQLMSTLLTMQTNRASSASDDIFPSKPSAQGLTDYAQIRAGTKAATPETIYGLAVELPKDMWTDISGPTLGYESRVPEFDELADAINLARNEMTGKGSFPTGAEKDQEFIGLQVRLESIAKRFYETEQRKPKPDELRAMARPLFFDMTDGWWSNDATDTLGEFLDDPSAGLDLTGASEARDVQVAEAAINFAQRAGTKGDQIVRRFNIPGVTFAHQLTLRHLETRPELAAVLIEYGIATNAPAVGTYGFRDKFGVKEAND